MIYKSRTESNELIILRFLNKRMPFSVDNHKHFFNLEKGFNGEIQFDHMIKKLQSNSFILNDLQLESNKTRFQIDSLIIQQESIYLFEVKNYEGDFLFDSEAITTLSGKEYRNPQDQLKRSTALLRQLLQEYGSNLTIKSYVIFINPGFTLYQANDNLPFIFPTQLKRFLNKLEMQPSRLNIQHKQLAKKLISSHITEAPYSQLPTYEFNHLKLGLTCNNCYSFSISVFDRQIVCNDCETNEAVELAVLRSVSEFKLLFPNQKITTSVIHKWCKIIQSKKRIQRILTKHLKRIGNGRYASYE
ncbi:nuclease-related domain-containing protein [Bacillus sp. PS06]|uniref:nuclease-related domain-containing protein n=1 Tax=Bacillus sp. PS06 TaxID=2764176 RepID=UPI001786D3D6|nr:nuclease-related domain-containing protein [Bacillus sp. PS06]MBD8067581.1 NERD domain-containing protein [Bacillus sp. PS06]